MIKNLVGSPMVRERLFTPEGGFVTEVSIPPFLTPPEVLIWGARVFIRVDSYELVDFEPMPGIEAAEGCYIEAFAYHCPPEMHHSTLPGGLDKIPPPLRDRALTLSLAISDAETRIASNPEDTHYGDIQRAKIRAWQTELNAPTEEPELVRDCEEGESMQDRVYVPTQEAGIIRRLCECKLEPGYHWIACSIAVKAKELGIARMVFVRDEPKGELMGIHTIPDNEGNK